MVAQPLVKLALPAGGITSDIQINPKKKSRKKVAQAEMVQQEDTDRLMLGSPVKELYNGVDLNASCKPKNVELASPEKKTESTSTPTPNSSTYGDISSAGINHCFGEESKEQI